MILDYSYNKKRGKLSLSYINKQGLKSVLDFNVDKFKTYYKTPNGKYTNWDGSRCDEMYTQNPSRFDIWEFLSELNPKYKELIDGKESPQLYTFDIETKLKDNGDFTNPAEADMPIHTISCVSPKLKTLVMGDKPLSDEDIQWIQDQIHDYLKNIEFFHSLNIPLPEFKYQYYNSEEQMIKNFMRNIVAKVPILSGWNCIGYDWQYITSRVKNYFPNLTVAMSSSVYQLTQKSYKDMKGDSFTLPLPLHTPIVDMMDVIDNFDLSGLTAKESTSLDYIASETPGLNVHKIEYDGDLEYLYNTDYRRYVFYNAVDSLLVQLIDKRYKTLSTMYMQALYCRTKIQDTFSKISVSEALTWNDFHEHGYKVVYERREDKDRGRLQGAYVAIPKPGLWEFVSCNDYASLYPSTIITCNLSFDNFVGTFYLESELEKYSHDSRYIVIGPNVHENIGTADRPELGECLYTFVDDRALDPYRKDPNYFVSVNGHVYKNDKDYTFKRIQAKLKATRNISKYLGKQLDAVVMLDIEHILKDKAPSTEQYHDNLIDAMKQMGYGIKSSNDLLSMSRDQLLEFKRILGSEIIFYMCKEQAMKLLGNSMYGGSSHIAFYWFNINLARDITGEARNLIHMMEHDIPEYFEKNWLNMKDLHQKLGITVNPNADTKRMIQIIAGDTDSCSADTVVKTNTGDVSIEEFFNRNNTGYVKMTPGGSELISTKEQILNYDGKSLCYQPVNYIMRHKVSKPKWRLKTKSGKEVVVTEDHSLIVFRNGIKMEVKPREVLKTDKILIVE